MFDGLPLNQTGAPGVCDHTPEPVIIFLRVRRNVVADKLIVDLTRSQNKVLRLIPCKNFINRINQF